MIAVITSDDVATRASNGSEASQGVATTVIVKMHRAKYLWVTCVPLAWLVVVTFTAAWQKIFSDSPAIGFLAQADRLAAGPHNASTAALVFNNRIDAAITGVFLVLVAAILIDSIRVWTGILFGGAERTSTETPFIASALTEEV